MWRGLGWLLRRVNVATNQLHSNTKSQHCKSDFSGRSSRSFPGLISPSINLQTCSARVSSKFHFKRSQSTITNSRFRFHLQILVSGEVPQEPVVSKTSGLLFEKRLIEKSIKDQGKCPVTGEALSVEDLLQVQGNFETHFKVTIAKHVLFEHTIFNANLQLTRPFVPVLFLERAFPVCLSLSRTNGTKLCWRLLRLDNISIQLARSWRRPYISTTLRAE